MRPAASLRQCWQLDGCGHIHTYTLAFYADKARAKLATAPPLEEVQNKERDKRDGGNASAADMSRRACDEQREVRRSKGAQNLEASQRSAIGDEGDMGRRDRAMG